MVLVDAHPSTLAGLRMVLELEFDIVGEADNAGAALESVAKHQPDLCVLDVHLSGSLECVRAMIERSADTAVVATARTASEEEVFAAVTAGVRGYILKDVDPTRVATVLRAVARGEAALPRFMVTRLLDEVQGKRRRRRLDGMFTRGEHLTDREFLVLELLRDGATTTEIARRLGVAPVTVRTHVSAILRKLDASSREEALAKVEAVDPD